LGRAQHFDEGDVVGLLLDCDAGKLTLKKNGVWLGVAKTGLAGQFCWAAVLWDRGDICGRIVVRIVAADAAAFWAGLHDHMF
jgi:hypothetical protein